MKIFQIKSIQIIKKQYWYNNDGNKGKKLRRFELYLKKK